MRRRPDLRQRLADGQHPAHRPENRQGDGDDRRLRPAHPGGAAEGGRAQRHRLESADQDLSDHRQALAQDVRGPVRAGAAMSARRGALLLALGLAAGSCAPYALAPPAEPPLSLLGSRPLIVPFGATVGGFRVGGLSAIARAADGTYLAVVDNEGETPARVFRLAFTVSESGVAPPPGRTPLEVPVAAIPLARSDGEKFNGKNFDGEGLALEPSGEMLIASETEPSIREFSLEGRTLRSLPVPELFLAGRGKGIRNNLGFESLTLAPGGDVLWTADERALQQDAPEDLARPSPVRLLRYERRNGGFVPGAQFVYEVEPLQQKLGAGFQTRGLSDL